MSIVFSIILHFAVIIVVKYALNLTFEKPLVNPEYVMITTKFQESKEPEKLHGETKQKENPEDRTNESEQVKESELPESNFYLNFDDKKCR